MSYNEEMDYTEDDESSDEVESSSSSYYGVSNVPSTYPVSYPSRKTERGSKNDSNILPLRKSIMVGSSYQASIPGLIKSRPPYADKKKPYSGEDKLIWNPYKLSDEEVERYLVAVQKLNFEKAQGVAAIPRGAHTRDDEQALYMLLQCGYGTEKALQKIKSAPPENNTTSYWTEEECKNFESGIRIYGKEFFLIHNNKVKPRSVGELVQFYYLWKKTERHDVFANRVKLEKKKYSLHPGVTFLEDHDEYTSFKDGTFTNIHCLIYGDAKKLHRGADLTNQAFYGSSSPDASKNNSKTTSTYNPVISGSSQS